MADVRQIEQALINADKAGDVEAARVLAAELVKARRTRSAAPVGPTQGELDTAKREVFLPQRSDPVNVAGFDMPFTHASIDTASRFVPALKFLTLTARPDVGRGVVDVGQGAKQLAKHVARAEDTAQYDQALSQELRDYEAGRGGDAAGFDWGRLAGNVGATSFLGLARAPAAAGPVLKYGLTAVQGAAGGAAQPVDTDKGDFATQKTVQAGVGAAVAPAAQLGLEKGASFIANKARQAGEFLANVGRRVTGKVANPNAVLDVDGTLTPKGQAALKNLGLAIDDLTDDVRERLKVLASDATAEGRALTPEQQIRSAMIKEVTGEDATLGQVTRDFGQQQTEHDVKKINSIGAPLRARFAKQNRGLLDRVKQLREAAGGTAIDEYEVGRRVSTAVNAADKEAKEAVSMLYQAIDKEYGGQFKIKPQGLLGKLDEIGDNAESDTIVASVQRKLKRFGLMNDAGNLKRGASLNAAQAEELRKFVGGLGADSPNKKRMLGILVDALDDDVKVSAGDDVYAIARDVAKTRFEDLRIPAVRAIVDGEVKPEQVFDKYVRRGGIDDLEALKGYMSRKTTKPPAGGSEFDAPETVDPHQLGAAWDELRGQTLAHVFERSTRQAAKNELDDVVFSGAEFKKALYGQGGIGRRKLEILFTKEELAALDKVANVAEWRIPMADVLNTSNTNSAWWNMVDRVLSYLPGKTGMVLRGAGRAAKVGADELADEASAAAAMSPGTALARRAEEDASSRVAEETRKAVTGARAPSFMSLGAERKRKGGG